MTKPATVLLGLLIISLFYGATFCFATDEQEALRFNGGLVHLVDHVEADSGISLAE